MDEQEMKKYILYRRLTTCRADLVGRHPFFGRLLLRLAFGFAPCGTAYTDMSRIVFDPDFGTKLDDSELEFVLLHEVMHCVLKHCIRGKQLHRLTYNIACDIVVNSLILRIMGRGEFTVAGRNAMHLTPEGKEGREYSAEEVYAMFLTEHGLGEDINDIYPEGAAFDSHDMWDQVTDVPYFSDRWNSMMRDAATHSSGSSQGIPDMLARPLGEILRSSRVSWRQFLADFLRHNRSDFVFERPDVRYAGQDAILPSFTENVFGAKVERIWALIDASGSVSQKGLERAYSEILGIYDQLDGCEGYLSFFDTHITEPQEFMDAEDVLKIRPVGGGGTDFGAIFDAMPTLFGDELPAAIVILTDGLARFPPEEAAGGIPVLWIIINSSVNPPWGVTAHADFD